MSGKKSKELRRKFENHSGFLKEDRSKLEYKIGYKEYKNKIKKFIEITFPALE